MIHFKKISYKNFLSVGNVPIEVDFDEAGSYLIIGRNGAGKSTLGEAVCFALYGKPYRKINKPQLVNTVNKRDLVVEMEFNSNGNIYLVRRGMKPTLFEVYENGKLIDQSAASGDYQSDFESKILRMNFAAFKQIVMLGSTAYIPFMELKSPQRREMIEELLNLKIFSVMSKLNSKVVQDAKGRYKEIQIRLETTNEKIKLIKANIARFLQNTDEIVATKKENLQKQTAEFEKASLLAVELEAQLKEIQEEYNEISSTTRTKFDKTVTLRNKVVDRQRAITRDLEFFNHTNKCPTCAQGIDEEYRLGAVTQRESTLQELSKALVQLGERLKLIRVKQEEVASLNKAMSDTQSRFVEARSTVRHTQSSIQSIQEEIKQLLQQRESYVNDEDQIEALKKYQVDLANEKKDIITASEIYKIASNELRDAGIKARLIKEYVPTINKYINKYLAAMDFFVQFELDENFDEVIRSRFRDEFSYHSFSEGEKFRIDLSLLLTWRAIARLRNSCVTNLLFLDEIFDSSLDNTGIEEFMKLLDALVSEGTTVMVVSHKGDQLRDKFEHVIEFEKVKNFTTMKEEQ